MRCNECTLDGKAVEIYLPRGTYQYNTLWVGQAPGKTELVTGIPFTGGAGKMQYSLMKEAGLWKTQFPWTNIVQCMPPEDREPTPHEVKCCINHLIREIWEIQPQLICALGGLSAKVLTDKSGIMSLRGSFFPLSPEFEYECDVLCLLHPSFVMRQRQWIPIAVKDLKQVHEYFIQGAPPKKEYNFIHDPSEKELKQILFRKGKPWITFDIETTSLDPFEATVLGIGFAWTDYDACGVYFTQDDPRLSIIRTFLESEAISKKSAQNASFDCKTLLISKGMKVQGLQYDTRLGEQLINSDMPKNLDHLRAVYTNIQPYKPPRKEMARIGSWGKEKMLEYVCWDAVTTYQVMKKQQNILTSVQHELMRDHLVPLVEVLNSMEMKGVKVDVPTLAILYKDKYLKSQELQQKIVQELNILPSSPKQISSKFGLKSSDRESLEAQIKRGHPSSEQLQMILDYRDLSKGASTFLKGVYDRLRNGRIHTQYNIEGTGTGRLSSENPNLQNVPKPYRVIYIPDDQEEYVFIRGDYAQLELWVAAVLAPGEALLNDLRQGIDVHGVVLTEMEPHIPERLLWNKRTVTKEVVFGTLYGRTARSIAIEYGVPTVTAEKWQELCNTKYPELVLYTQEKSVDVRKKGYVDTPFGRRRYVQSIPQGLNAPIQSSASDITLGALNLAYYQEGLDLRLQVHDEVVIQAPRKGWKERAVALKRAMERPVPQLGNTSFPATIKVGYNWYEMEEVKL